MAKTYFIILTMLFSKNIQAQHGFMAAYDVTMEGYIFTMQHSIFFQPLDFNSRLGFLESLDNRNFMLMTQKDLMYEESLHGIGHSLIIDQFPDTTPGSLSKLTKGDSLFYFKTTLKLSVAFLDTAATGMKVLPQGRYNFFVNNTSYRFFGVFVRSEICDIIPERKEYIKKMYEYYKNQNFGKPTWLEKRFKKLYPQKTKRTKQ